MSKNKLNPITEAIRIQIPVTGEQEHSTPLYLTSSFRFDEAETMRAAFADENDENIYSRFSNPNVDEFIKKMCVLESVEAGFATATGMAAVFASMFALLKQGDHLICCSSVFGSTHTMVTKFLPRYGNCFATPLLQKPVEYGADLIVHSATKWIDGQGRVLGGVVVGKADLIKDIYLFSRNTGPSLSAFNAWILSKSLETLDVRLQRHCENAMKVASALKQHKNISWVKYPFLDDHPQYAIAKKQMKAGGGIVCFEVKGGIEKGRQFLNNLKMLSMTANLGDTRSIASHPASTTHSKLSEEERLSVGITPGLIRISVGLEYADDIINDLVQALD